MTTEEKAKAYDKALSKAREYHFQGQTPDKLAELESIFPELRESEDEKMMNQLHSWMIEFGGAEEYAERVFQWLKGLLEKQKEPNLAMIQWTGNNLKEVIEFTGKSDKFEKWFKSWDEYEAYVRNSGNILKLFCEGDDHYKVPVGAWIIKTPDGHNIPSCFEFVHNPEKIDENKIIKKHITEDSLSSEVNKRLKECGWYVTDEKPAEWSEEDDWKRKELIQYLEEKGDYRTVWMTWLKSLRPQTHWKPSNEQMNHLSAAVIEAQRRHNESVNGFPRYRVLKELYEQLKKLM